MIFFTSDKKIITVLMEVLLGILLLLSVLNLISSYFGYIDKDFVYNDYYDYISRYSPENDNISLPTINNIFILLIIQITIWLSLIGFDLIQAKKRPISRKSLTFFIVLLFFCTVIVALLSFILFLTLIAPIG